ncbi:MAG: iron-containing alcohol dehydrogenase [Brevinema sp.]
MDFNYFHIPTRIVQGYESFTNLNELSELSKKRVVMVTDSHLINVGATQNLRRFIENIAYGLIFYEVPSHLGAGLTDEGVGLLQDSRAQTVIGFGNTHTLSVARGMVQTVTGTTENKISYIEIPTLPCICPGLITTYYVSNQLSPLKKPHQDFNSRADWLFLDSSYTEFYKVSDLLEHAVQSLAYALDALFSRNVSLLSESYALKAIELIVTAGFRLPHEPANLKLKTELMLGSLLASFAIQSSNLGIIAGLSMALENSFITSERHAAGAVLISALEYSLVSNLDKFQKIYRVLGLGKDSSSLEAGVKVLELFKDLLIQMEIHSLSTYKAHPKTLENVARQASRYNFMMELSRPTGCYELLEILNTGLNNGFELSHNLAKNVTEPVALY